MSDRPEASGPPITGGGPPQSSPAQTPAAPSRNEPSPPPDDAAPPAAGLAMGLMLPMNTDDLSALTKMAWRQIRKLVIFVVGMTVVLCGVAMIVLPGPAFVVIPLGLLILSTEFVWAKHLLNAVRERIKKSMASVTGARQDNPPSDKDSPSSRSS